MRKGSITAVLIVFLLLAVFWTYPLIGHYREAVPYTIAPQPGLEIVHSMAGDHLQFYYRLWLFYDSLLKGRPFSPTGYEFNEYMGKKAVSSQFVPLSLLYAIFAPLGTTVAYNLLLWLTFPLTGLFSFLMIRGFGGGFWDGLVGALASVFLPYRLGQLMGGHPNGFVFFVIPLMLWLVEGYLRTGQRWRAWLAGLVIFSQAIMELHAAYYTFLLLAFFLPFRWLLPLDRWMEVVEGTCTDVKETSSWKKYLPWASIFLFRVFYLNFRAAGRYDRWTIFASAMVWALAGLVFYLSLSHLASAFFKMKGNESAGRVLPVFLPLVLLPLYGINFIYPVPYLGRFLLVIATLASIIIGVRNLFEIWSARSFKLRVSGIFAGRMAGLLPMVLGMILSIAWALFLKQGLFAGTSLEGGRTLKETLLFTPPLINAFRRTNPLLEFYVYPGLVCLMIVFFAFVLSRSSREEGEDQGRWPLWFFGLLGSVAFLFCFGKRGEVIFPLYGLARNIVPFMKYARVPSRVMIIFAPALSVVVGLSFGKIVAVIGHKKLAAALSVLTAAAILADFWPAAGVGLSVLPERNSVYEATFTGEGAKLVEVPIWPGDSAWSSIYQYWITRYGHKTINGYSPVVPAGYHDKIFSPLASLNVGYLGEEEAALLNSLGVSRLVLHREAFPPKVSLFPFTLTRKGLESSPYLDFEGSDDPLWSFRVLKASHSTHVPLSAMTSPMGLLFQAESPVMHPRKTTNVEGVMAALGEKRGEAVIAGPGRLFPAGRFRARFRLGAVNGKEGEEALLRLTDEQGSLLDQREITVMPDEESSMVFQDYYYVLSRPKRLIFELYPLGQAPMAVDYLYIIFQDQKEPFSRAEMEDLLAIGRIVEDGGAAGGQAVRLRQGIDPPLSFRVGPRRYIPPGYWEVVLFYRVEGERSRGGFVRLQDFGGESIGSEAIPLDPGEDNYHSARMPLYLQKGVFLDMEITYSGKTDLFLDRIEVNSL